VPLLVPALPLLELDDPPLPQAAAVTARTAAASTLVICHRMTCPIGRSVALKDRVL
jgi:hypothetical protein